MTDFEASLASIAASYQMIAANLDALRRLHGYTLVLLGLALAGLGLALWYAVQGHHEHAAALQALTAQTEALRQLLRPH